MRAQSSSKVCLRQRSESARVMISLEADRNGGSSTRRQIARVVARRLAGNLRLERGGGLFRMRDIALLRQGLRRQLGQGRLDRGREAVGFRFELKRIGLQCGGGGGVG